MSAAARNRSVGRSRSRLVRTSSSWASVRGWNASATSAGTGSAPSVGLGTRARARDERRGIGERPGRRAPSQPRHRPPRRGEAPRAASAPRPASPARPSTAVSRWANGLRSLPTPIRPSADAWSGVVPRPENGSRTTSPRRRIAGDEGVGEGRREAREVRAHRVERVAPQPLLVLPLGRDPDRRQLGGQLPARARGPAGTRVGSGRRHRLLAREGRGAYHAVNSALKRRWHIDRGCAGAVG